jgi:hypothetical protein
MKRSLKNLTGFSIETIDKVNGNVKDFLFDEERWVIKYLEAEFGNLYSNKKILIPRYFLKKPNWEHRIFPINLTGETVTKCPVSKNTEIVSREYEEEMKRYYGVEGVKEYEYVQPTTIAFPPRPIHPPAKKADERYIESSVRSFREVHRYQIHTRDKNLGHLEDMIVDDEDWQIIYLLIDTSNWSPISKKVLIPIDQLKEISYASKEVKIGWHSDTIKNAPEYDPARLMEETYEKNVFDFYSRSLVK